MMKRILVAAALLAFPAASFAATYQYVDTSGTVESVNADSPAEAFANAGNIAPDSGVAIDNGTIATGADVSGAVPGVPSTGLAAGDADYQYVNTAGVVQTVAADSAADALVSAPDLAAHSGVAIDTGDLQNGEPVAGTQ